MNPDDFLSVPPATKTAQGTSLKKQIDRQQALEASEFRFRTMIEQAPVAMGVLRGSAFVVETANNSLLELWGKDSSVIGLPLLEALPEIKHQPFLQLLENVLATGEPYYGFETLARLVRNGKPEDCYFNFVYAPYVVDQQIAGVQVVANEVTHQFKAKKLLAASEERFRNLILQAPMATALYSGREMIITLANDAMLRVWGKNASVVGLPLHQALPEITDQPFLGLLQQVYDTGVAYQATEDPATLEVDGRLQTSYFNFTYKPQFDETGKVYAIINMAVDVTQAVIARKKIEQQEANFRKMTDAIPTMIWTTDTAGNADYLNLQWYEYTGQSAATAYGKGWLDAVHPEDATKTSTLFGEAISSREPVQFLYRLRNKAGYYRWFLDMAAPRFNTEGVFEGYAGSVVDVHETIVAQEKLAHAEERLRLAADGTGLGTWDLDLVSRDIFYSGKLNEIFGIPPGIRLSHRQMREQVHRDDIHIVEKAFERALETGYYEYEARIVQAGDLQKWVRTQGRIIFSDAGKPLRMLGTMMDITEQKKDRLALEESEQRFRELSQELEKRVQQRTQDLLKANENLERSNDELAQYAYVASHDLQEPLRKIRIFSGLLKDHQHSEAEERRMLEKVISSSERMTLLIRDLLEYSRLIKDGKLVQPTDLNQVLRQVQEDFELSIQEQKAIITVSELPVLEAVPLQMNQLFNNLFSNALKFTRPGVKPQLIISSRVVDPSEIKEYQLNHEKKYFEFVFADNGIGFQQQFADQIFDVFKRLHNRHAYPGSGIGLAVCRKIVENHGGLMLARSEEGKGARFHVILPEKQTAE